MEEMRRAERRGEAVDALRRADLYLDEHPGDEEVKEARERLGDREERRFFLKYYAPVALIAFLAMGYSSERWAVSVVAAVVVAMPVAVAAYGIVRLLKTFRGGRGNSGGTAR